MTIKELYDATVRRINEIDMELAELRGKRKAYDDVRLDLFGMIEDMDRCELDKEQEDGKEDR